MAAGCLSTDPPCSSPSSTFQRREGIVVERFYYALTWTCRFPVSGDTCYFAHCFPYTYSDLKAGSTQTHIAAFVAPLFTGCVVCTYISILVVNE